MSLNEWLSGPGTSESLVLDPLARQRLSTYLIQSDAVSVLVGPEGGFSEAEIRQIGSAGVAAVSLGPRVLRTETAGPAAITLLQSMAGDF
jgi:16S rRNA (uracil1498-N3)-methyltransferase